MRRFLITTVALFLSNGALASTASAACDSSVDLTWRVLSGTILSIDDRDGWWPVILVLDSATGCKVGTEIKEVGTCRVGGTYTAGKPGHWVLWGDEVKRRRVEEEEGMVNADDAIEGNFSCG